MSKGMGAYARKINELETSVIYEYGGYNLNDPEYRNAGHIYDGTIMILKECFAEPEIHKKVKKTTSGKKLIIKRIPVDVEYGQMLADGRIVVENCSNCWHTVMGNLQVDEMACHLLFYIFRGYQEEGKIPETIGYNV